MYLKIFRSRDWFIIAPLALLAVFLGVWGFTICNTADCETPSIFTAFLRTLSLLRGADHFSAERDPWQLVVAQVLLPLSLLAGGAKLVLQNLRRDLRLALAGRMRGHTIVCGLGDTGSQIVANLLNANRQVTAITRDERIAGAIASEQRGVAVLPGDALQEGTLAFAGLRRAEALVLATGDDATNIEIGLRAREACGKRAAGAGLKIYCEVRNEWLYDAVQARRAASLSTQSASFELFNLNASAARALLRSESFMDAAAQKAEQPHLVIVGFGQAAAEVAIRAIVCNFAVPGERLLLTVFDSDNSAAGIIDKFPRWREFADVTIVTGALDFTRIGDLLSRSKPIAIIVDLADDDKTLKTALELRQRLDSAGGFDIPVCPRLRRKHDLGAFLRDLESLPSLADRFVPFGDTASLTGPEILFDQSLDTLARAAHEVYLASAGSGNSPAQVPWPVLPEHFKQSNRAFADHIPIKLAHIGMSLTPRIGDAAQLEPAEIESLAQMEHWRWSLEQQMQGWVHGAERNDLLKRHPMLLAWDKLPETAKDMNRDMVRRIPAILDVAGLSAIRRKGTLTNAAPASRDAADRPAVQQFAD